MTTDNLKKIGLTQAEIKVYEALLYLGNSSLNKIQERTAIERRYIYDVLAKLIEKGLVSYTIEKGKKTYQTTHPEKILAYVDEKIQKYVDEKKEIGKKLPSLIKQYKEHSPEIKSEIFRGKEGFKALSGEMLQYKENWFIGGSGEIQELLPYFWKHYNKRRILKKIMWHDLIESGSLMDCFKGISKDKLKKNHHYEYRILPKVFNSPNIICIFGNKVANMLWESGLFAFIIENKKIAQSYTEYFNLLWEHSKE